MGRSKTTQYPWGTERPASKLEKLQARVRGLDRDLAVIENRSLRDQMQRLRDNRIDIDQIEHILHATINGPYNRAVAASHPWVETCMDEGLNNSLVEANKLYEQAKTGKTKSEALHELEMREQEHFDEVVRARLLKLAEQLGRTGDEVRCQIDRLVPYNIPQVIRLLGLEPVSDEVYFAFRGVNEVIPLPNRARRHPDYDRGWPDPLRPPEAIRALFPYSDVVAAPDVALLSEAQAWRWLEIMLFEGLGEMPPPWKERALEPHGGSAIRALTAEFKRNPKLASKYHAEAFRQHIWPFFVERREKIRFFLRLYHWWCFEFEDIERALADFDRCYVRPWSNPEAAQAPTFAALLPIFDRVFELLPWPEGFGRTTAMPEGSGRATVPAS